MEIIGSSGFSVKLVPHSQMPACTMVSGNVVFINVGGQSPWWVRRLYKTDPDLLRLTLHKILRGIDE